MQQSFDATYLPECRANKHADNIIPEKLHLESVEPAIIPDSLKAKIVDPKSFAQIPIIDMSADDATVIEQLRYSCEVVGFMQVVGHGVSFDLIQRHGEFHRRFFDLSTDTKEG